ncbi:flagellin domain-containing protein [Mycolicibacterium novocastrense]|uniref:Flagellin domain-containing protein n=1 Tax=Mycolicibacterium novocastrense TaxID=59813 RepID=A0ABQ0KDU3_MYCNV|nr:flagellin domain-containing protein [Mycolicibacterium novocastrense]
MLGGLLARVAEGAGSLTWTGTFDFGSAGSVTLSIRDVDVARLSVPARDLLLVTAARLATLGMSQQGMWRAVSLSPSGGGR